MSARIAGSSSVNIVTGGALGLLVATLLAVLAQPAGTSRHLQWLLHRRRFRPLHENRDADRLGRGACDVGRIPADRKGVHRFEYPILILLSTLGMMMLISAGDLIALYLGLELMSLALYVVAAFHRDDVRATEAGLKYFVLGALSSGMLLYGASLVYGFTGSVSFPGIADALNGHGSMGVVFGLVFVMAGLAFKISAVPFHMWTPDVYEGAPTPVTAFFASAPKMAAMA